MALGLYLHIPFCQSICSYCNFNRGLLDGDLKRRYVDALEQEIRSAGPGAEADTIFFGGGTPSLLEADEVARLIAACRETFAIADDAEITLETNPETATAERLHAFRRAGVTRVSFGVQSFDDAELKRLGRLHSADRARSAIQAAQAVGFADVSFDLMFWLPGQSMSSWLSTVDGAIALSPNHLSLYLLELYPNAPLKESIARSARGRREDRESSSAGTQSARGRREDSESSSAGTTASGGGAPLALINDWTQVADDDAAEMYLEALARLDKAGFEQYEISNVARPGHASRHNVKYWEGQSWYGFGCGAHSTVHGVRWKNVTATADYVERIGRGAPVTVERRTLTERERFEERLFMGLRLSAGVSRDEMVDAHGVDPWTEFGDRLRPFVDERLMWLRGDRFGLTRQGMLVANEILATFV